MQYTHDVIIIGAGIAGSAMARCAAVHGLQVALLDQQAPHFVTHETHLRVSNINLASERFLNTLGVIFPDDRRGIFNHMQIFQENYLQTLNFSAQILGVPYLGSIIENNVLIQQMQDPKINHFWPVQLEKIVFKNDSVLLYGQGIDELCAPLVIGAEGAHSWLREQMGIAHIEKPYGQTALVTHIETQQTHQYSAYQRFLTQGPLAYLPLKAQRQCSIVWSSTPEHIKDLMALDDATLADQIAQGMMHHLGEVNIISARACFPLVMRHAKRYVAPRVALIGDAIHTIHPLAGQGANLGLMDVACLTRQLLWAKQHHRDIGSLPMLRYYERERRFANTCMLQAVQLLAKNSGLFPLARSLGMSLIEHSTLIKRLLMQSVQDYATNVAI